MSVLTSTNNQQNLPRYFARVFDLVSKLNSGRVDFILPDGRRFRAEGLKPGPVAEVTTIILMFLLDWFVKAI